MPTTSQRKVLLIGWDAADWKVIEPLMEAGKMPNLRRLVENGAMASIATLHPPLSPMLWTSIATGKRPFKHGVLGFAEPTPDGRGVQPVTNLSRKAKAVWNIFQQNGLKSIVVGWWPSHPAEPINGVMVSDHFHRAAGPLEKGWPLQQGAVQPPELAETLADLRMHPDELALPMIQAFIPEAANIDHQKDYRLLAAAKTLCECVSIHSAATWLLDNKAWDFFAVYYDSIDHFCHGFMKYHPPKQEWVPDKDFELYQGVVNRAYEFHDQMLGTLIEKAGAGVDVIVMSDHGFHPDHLRPRVIPEIPAGPAIEHRDFGILVLSGKGIRADELIHGASVLDVTPTLLAMFGLPVGEDMDGKVLTAAFEAPPETGRIPSWEDVPGDDGRHPPNTRLDPVAAKEALDQLVALGYIERPGENAEQTVANTIRELEYNLCESYQDADRHADALEISRRLHKRDPDEQRFAVKRFVSCQALGYTDEMRLIVEDLDGRRRDLFRTAVGHMIGYRELAKQRFEERKAAGDAETAADAEIMEAGPTPPPEPLLNESERKDMAKWRHLTRFQPPVVDYLKAQVLTAEKKWSAALDCLNLVGQAELARPGLLLQSAELYARLQRWDKAGETYAKALEIDPDNAHAHLGMCRVALRNRDYSAAAQSALHCVQRQHQYPMAHFLLGVALTGLRHYVRAAEALRTAVSLNPNFPQAHIRMAWLLKHKLKDAAGAENHLRLYRETRRQRVKGPPSLDETRVDDPNPTPSPAVERPDVLLPPVGEGVVVVCGLPRSGTSLIMQMLAAGGFPILSDAKRVADEDNPLGYFEFEPVKSTIGYGTWIDEAAGKAVKIVAPLILSLPVRPGYRVILVERDADEILASQGKMIERREPGRETNAPERQGRLKREYTRVIENVKLVLNSRADVDLLTIRHSDVMRDPGKAARRLNLFCGGGLSEAAMAACIRLDLHRQKAGVV